MNSKQDITFLAHSKPPTSPLVLTVPRAHAVDGSASKDRWHENVKSILVIMTLKWGQWRGESFKYVVPHEELLSDHALIPKKTTGEVPRQGTTFTDKSLQNLISSHRFALVKPAGAFLLMVRFFFPSEKSYLSFQRSSCSKKNFWSAIPISF